MDMKDEHEAENQQSYQLVPQQNSWKKCRSMCCKSQFLCWFSPTKHLKCEHPCATQLWFDFTWLHLNISHKDVSPLKFRWNREKNKEGRNRKIHLRRSKGCHIDLAYHLMVQKKIFKVTKNISKFNVGHMRTPGAIQHLQWFCWWSRCRSSLTPQLLVELKCNSWQVSEKVEN